MILKKNLKNTWKLNLKEHQDFFYKFDKKKKT